MMLLGIISGLTGSLSQSGAYIFSRLYVLKSRQAILHLLILSHVVMGLTAVLILPALIPNDIPALSEYGSDLTAAAGFYLFGQSGLLILMRRMPPSSVAPLLGLKVLVLAVINLLVFHVALTPGQWFAVVLCAAAALVLNATGSSIGIKGIALVLVTCSGYSLSDLGISRLIASFPALSLAHAAALSVCMCYALLGAVAAVLLVFLKRPFDWGPFLRFGLPYSACWFLGMGTLFFSIACLGPVYAVMLQSTRSLWSILLGVLLAHLGHIHIEDKVGGHIVARRITAALMMIAAVWLYSTQT